MAWWNLAIRSERPWASGTAFWYDRAGDPISATARLAAEEADVALIDAMTASSVGTNRDNISTWARLIGDPVGAPIATGALNSIDTQFDWRTSTLFGFGHCVEHLPRGGAYAADGSGWLVWTCQSIPSAEATSLASSPIWAAVSAGTHDAKYIKFGERIVTKMAAVGHPLKRLIIDFNHEMNQSNDFQIWAGNRAEYKAAMEQTITKVRQGADNITPGAGAVLKFMHRPGYRVDQGATKIGPYNSFVPNNVDVLALSIHPDGSCNSDAAVDALFAGTLNAQWYGTDELIAHSITTGLPIAFPEWSPQFQTLSANGGACPAADRFVTKFFTQVLQPNQGRLVCECIWHQNVRDPTGYTATDATGIAQWAAMVDSRKLLWIGKQSDDTIPTSDSFTYTVADDWGQRTATVNCTIEGGSVLYVSAGDDAGSTSPGVSVVIPVLDNDTASPSLLPLEIEPGSVSGPVPDGAASVTTDNKIRFTPASGAFGIEATFTYRARPTTALTPVSTGTVRVQVGSGPAPGGEFPSSAGFTVRPSASGATTIAQFAAAYAAAQPGDHVVAANGLVIPVSEFTNNFDKGGTTADPIVIRAANNQQASFTGSLWITGSNLYFWGFQAQRLRNNTTNGAPLNRNITMRRMLFDNGGTVSGSYVAGEMNSLDFTAEYCTFCNAGGGIRFNSRSLRGIMRKCHWFNIRNPDGDIPAEALIVLEGIGTTYTLFNGVFEDLLFEDCNTNTDAPNGTENETISNKSSNNIYRRVQFNNCRDFNMRFGNDCQMLGCVVRPGAKASELSARGMRHIYNNCEGTISLDSGNYLATQGDATTPPTGHPTQADYANCIDCEIIGGGNAAGGQTGDQARIKLGPDSGHTVRVTGTRIEGRGPIGGLNLSVNQADAPTVISGTSRLFGSRAGFPLGQGRNNNRVGVLGL